MADLASDTRVEGGDGHFRATLSRDWEIWGPNGGYIAALLLRAAGASTRMPRPASFACHFLSVAEFGEVELSVSCLRASKRAEALRVSMQQHGKAIAEAMIWCVGAVDGYEHDFCAMPAVAEPEGLASVDQLLKPEDRALRHRFWNNFDVRPLKFVPRRDRQAGNPVWREWYRFRPRATFTDEFVDAARSLILIDTLIWPAARAAYAADDNRYLAPSLDLTVQFYRSVRHSEWLLVDAGAPLATGGLIGGHANVWSRSGELAAAGGGQLLCRPAPAV